MKQLRITNISDTQSWHFLSNVIPGKYISRGALVWGKPDLRIHTNDGPDKKDYCVQDDEKIFVFLQGKGVMESLRKRNII